MMKMMLGWGAFAAEWPMFARIIAQKRNISHIETYPPNLDPHDCRIPEKRLGVSLVNDQDFAHEQVVMGLAWWGWSGKLR